jgi:Tfp pilus assembly protein PilF
MIRRMFFSLVLIATGLVAYSNSFSVPFVFDDGPQIADNPVIKDLGNFLSSSRGYEMNPRRYVGHLSFALNYHVGGLGVFGYHLVNLAIHILNALLVYFLVILTFRTPHFRSQQSAVSDQQKAFHDSPVTVPRSLLSPDHPLFTIHYSRFLAFFSALLFVVHPVQTQAVTYIVQRFTSLATLFYLLSLVFYIKGRISGRQSADSIQQPQDGSPFTVQGSRIAISVVWYVLSLLAAALAMKTKEIAFTLPLMIILYDFVFFPSTLKKKLLFLSPVLLTLIIIPISVMGTHQPLGEILSDLSEKTRVQTEISRGDYLMTQMRVITTYIRLIFFPVNQNLDYDYPLSRSFFTPSVLLSFVLLASLMGTAVYLIYKTQGAKRKAHSVESPMPYARGAMRLAGFGLLWFFIALSVESSFIPIVDLIFEHRIYLPSVGAFLALSAACVAAAVKVGEEQPRAGKAVLRLVLLAMVVLLGATLARNTVWHEEGRLWDDVVKKSPGKPRPHYNLGLVYHEKGLLGDAIREYEITLALDPMDAEAHNNLGNTYSDLGRVDDALREYQTALRLKPDSHVAHYNIANTYFDLGRVEEALREYRTALRLKPDYAEAHNNLGGIYFSQGHIGEALRELQIALKLNPDYAEARRNHQFILREAGNR